MKKKIYRRLRILEYVGTEEFMHNALDCRTVKGTYPIGENHISEALLGETNEIIGTIEVEEEE